jgi:hypothetical protein
MALVAIAGPSQAGSYAPPSIGVNDATVTAHGVAPTENDDATTIATPRGASGRAMATLISSENAAISGESAAVSGLSVGGVASAIGPGHHGTLASGPRTGSAPARNTALVALAVMLFIALIGVGGVALLERRASPPPPPTTAVIAPPDPAPAPPPSAVVEPTAAPPTASVATATPPKPVKPPPARPKHTTTTPTSKVGEIPNER